MENAYLSNPDLSYSEYQAFKLQRIKQQRQRMQTMKELVERYSQIISDLQFRNSVLQAENTQLRSGRQAQTHNHSEIHAQYSNLHEKYLKVCQQLDTETQEREKCEQIIEELRNQLTSTTVESMYRHGGCGNMDATATATASAWGWDGVRWSGNEQEDGKFTNNPNLNGISNHLLAGQNNDYDILFRLYQELQDQVYLIEKENVSLKDVIREQSKLWHQREEFWKVNQSKVFPVKTEPKEQTSKQNRPGLIKSSSKQNLKGSASDQIKPSEFTNQVSPSKKQFVPAQNSLKLQYQVSEANYGQQQYLNPNSDKRQATDCNSQKLQSSNASSQKPAASQASTGKLQQYNPNMKQSPESPNSSDPVRQQTPQPEKQRNPLSLSTSVKQSRRRQLQLQLQKKQEIIQKFKINEEQQLQLIEILKSQKSKVCKCHVGTSKKGISAKSLSKLVSFKNCEEDFINEPAN